MSFSASPLSLIVVATLFQFASASTTLPATQPVQRPGIPMHRLTSVVHAYATFSADGKQIAYQSNASGNWDIYLMNIDGTGVKPIIASAAADITPVFSPDGSRIAFVSERDGNRNVYTCDADGQHQRRLTDDRGTDLHPAWSADGKHIIFSSNRGKPNADDYDIYQMNADGTDQRRITAGDEIDTYASWSPDGAFIVTRRVIDNGKNNEVFVMKSDGSDARNLTNDPTAYDGWPVWSPDGKYIAFASGHEARGDHHIYLMRRDGTDRKRLTATLPGSNFAYFTQPTFSRDGKMLACTMYRPAGPQESSEIVLLEIPELN
jgi:TolB protein